MGRVRRSIGGVLLTVAFLVLASVATVIYSGDQEQKTNMEGKFFYRHTMMAFDNVGALIWAIANINNRSSSEDGNVEEIQSKTGFFSGIRDRMTREWQEVEDGFFDSNTSDLPAVDDMAGDEDYQNNNLIDSQENIGEIVDFDSLASEAELSDSSEKNSFALTEINLPEYRVLEWLEKEKGGEIVFRSKNGREYKLALPFRFLNKNRE